MSASDQLSGCKTAAKTRTKALPSEEKQSNNEKAKYRFHSKWRKHRWESLSKHSKQERRKQNRRAPDLAEAKSLSSVCKKHYQEEYGEKLPSEPPEERLLKMQITEYYFYHPATQGCTKWNIWLRKTRLCTPSSLNKMHLLPQIMMKLKQRNVTLKWCHVIF